MSKMSDSTKLLINLTEYRAWIGLQIDVMKEVVELDEIQSQINYRTEKKLLLLEKMFVDDYDKKINSSIKKMVTSTISIQSTNELLNLLDYNQCKFKETFNYINSVSFNSSETIEWLDSLISELENCCKSIISLLTSK